MAFDWKKKLEEGKKIASAAFETAVEEGTKLGDKIGQKVDELDQKYGPQVEASVKKAADKVTQKVDELRKPKG